MFLRGAPYLSLRRAPELYVNGLVVRVTADMVLRLRNGETVRYRLVHLRVQGARGALRALVFMGDAPTKRAWVADPNIMTLRSRTF